MKLRSLVLAAAVALAACGGQSQDPGTSNPGSQPDQQPATQQDPGVQKTTTQVTYPEGPYGVTAGDVLKNISVYGWRNPTDSSSKYDVLSLADFYDPDGTKGNKVLLVNVSAEWCSVCRAEAPHLIDECSKYKASGLVCYTSIFEDANYQPADKQTIVRWNLDFKLNYNLVVDPQNKWGVFFDKAATPMNMFVDLKTMKILEIQIGYDANAVKAAMDKYTK